MSALNDFLEVTANVSNSSLSVVAVEKEEEVYYQKSMEFIFEVVLLLSVGILGIIGNVSAIILFSRLENQLKFHQLMMTLSAFDTLYVVVSILLFALPQLSKGYMESGAHHYILPKALPVAQIALTGSIYSTLAITVERYLTVCHPFYTVSHRWNAKHYVAPIVTFSFLYNIPKFFELYTGVTLNDDNVTSTTSIEPTSLRVNNYYIQIYCIWMNFVFMGLGPFVLLIVLNLLTLKGLTGVEHIPVGRCSSLPSSQPSAFSSSASKKNEMLLAKVSLTIVFIFILCHSVKWIPNIFELLRVNFMENKRAWPPWVESVTHISHFLTTLNSSVNFYVYCFKHFNVISACWSDQESQTRSTSFRHRSRKHLSVTRDELTGSHRYSKNESEDQILTIENNCAQV